MRKRIATSFATQFAKGKTVFCCRTGSGIVIFCQFPLQRFTANRECVCRKQEMRLPLVANTVVESNALFCVMIYTDL